MPRPFNPIDSSVSPTPLITTTGTMSPPFLLPLVLALLLAGPTAAAAPTSVPLRFSLCGADRLGIRSIRLNQWPGTACIPLHYTTDLLSAQLILPLPPTMQCAPARTW